MIRINLLPIRAARKREFVKQQLLLAAVLAFGVLVFVFMWNRAVTKGIDDLKTNIARVTQKIEEHKRIIGEVDKYKGLAVQYQKKLDTIRALEKGRTGPVKFLDRISAIIPKEVWLTSWEEKAGVVTLQGEAISNKHIAQFITALKTRGDWQDQKTPPAESPVPPTNPPVPTTPPTAVNATGQPGGTLQAMGTQPGAKLLFSNVELVESKVEGSAKKGQEQVFFTFKIKIRVNYSI